MVALHRDLYFAEPELTGCLFSKLISEVHKLHDAFPERLDLSMIEAKPVDLSPHSTVQAITTSLAADSILYFMPP